MGIEYSAHIGVGFVFDFGEVLKPFTVTQPEQSHLEDRFDEKTGKKLKPKKVIDEEESEAYVLGKDDSGDDSWDFILSVLAKKLKCQTTIFGDMMGGDRFVLFGVPTKDAGQEGLGGSNVDLSGGISFSDVCTKKGKLKTLKGKLKAIGLKPKESVVQMCWNVG